MRRYQVYLNQHAVSALDEFGDLSNISRSKIIQSLVDRAAEQFIKVIARRRKQEKKYFLDSLAGFIDLKTKGKTHFAENIDEDIYFRDFK